MNENETSQGKKNFRRHRPHHKSNRPKDAQAPQGQQKEQLDTAVQSTATRQRPDKAQGQGHNANRHNRRRNRNRGANQGTPKENASPVQQSYHNTNTVNQRSFAQAFADTMPELCAPAQRIEEQVVAADQTQAQAQQPAEPTPALCVIDDLVEQTTEAQTDSEPQPTEQAATETAKQDNCVEVVGVHFRRSAKTYYFDPQGVRYDKGTFVIVQTANGMEYAQVSMENRQIAESEIVPPLRQVVRRATADDSLRYQQNREKEIEAYNACLSCIEKHGLDMKLVDTEYAFDNSKLLFYYISEGRVDFRELVKQLAAMFHVRIEMRQIGIRDETKMLGGLGACGRPFCCSTFLPDFAQVSIKMAKQQGLSLNSAKISGSCNRLMCCLRFEQEVYEQELKVTPKVDSYVRTEDGEEGIVMDAHPLTGLVKVRMCDNPEEPAKVYARETLTVTGYKKGALSKLLAERAAQRAQKSQNHTQKEVK